MSADGFDLDVFLAEFVSECREATDLAVQDVLNLERGCDQDSLDRIFRALHSIKGNASMFGLMELSQFVHRVEDTCSDIRSGERSIDKIAINVLLKSFDVIDSAFDHILDRGSDKIDYGCGYELLKEMNPACAEQEKIPAATAPDLEPAVAIVVGPPVSLNMQEDGAEAESCIDDIEGVWGGQDCSPQSTHVAAEIPLAGSAAVQSNQCYGSFSNVRSVRHDQIAAVRKNPVALVVDDDLASRKIFETFVSKYMPCYVAKDGVEAIEAVAGSFSGQTPRFDLILMDIMMPNIDGLQACKAIRQIEQSKNVHTFDHESKIFIVSTLDDDKTMLKAVYECGADACLAKPLGFEDLRKQLVRYRLIEPA